MKTLLITLAFCCLCARAVDKNQLPTVAIKVETDWGTLTSGYVVEEASVELTVRASGEPFSLSSSTSLPDPVVRALAQWRFNKYRKDGRDVAFTTVVKVPIRRILNGYYEAQQQPNFHTGDDQNEAIQLGSQLNPKSAARLLAKLPDSETPNNPRTSLLTYYSANSGAEGSETACKIRRELLSWLIQNDPQNSILLSPSAIVNAAGEPLADRKTSAELTKQWEDTVKQHPNDMQTIASAINFLRVADAPAALRVINSLPNSSKKSNWLGHVYALSGLGVTALSLDKGRAIATSSPKLPEDALPLSARQALLESSDLPLVLSAMWTTTYVGQELANRNVLPVGYAEYCGAFLKHTQALYPQTTLNCTLEPAISQTGAEEVHKAVLSKKVQPRYPPTAKQAGVPGKVELTAIVGLDGHPHNIELRSGSFAFYEDSCDAVRQWDWKPALFNGVPKAVVTDIIFDYRLGSMIRISLFSR